MSSDGSDVESEAPESSLDGFDVYDGEEELFAEALPAAPAAPQEEAAPENADELLQQCFAELEQQVAALHAPDARPPVSEAVTNCRMIAEQLQPEGGGLVRLAGLMEQVLLALRRQREALPL